MKVWHLERQEWVIYQKWMRWCPDIVTRYVRDINANYY